MIWENTFGDLPGKRPEHYWSPGLGNGFGGPGLRPSDIASLTPTQLFEAFESIG